MIAAVSNGVSAASKWNK